MASTKHAESWFKKFLRKRLEKRMFARSSPGEIFDWIYRTNKWGDDESVSGTGSNLEQTQAVRDQLPGLLRTLQVRTLLDAPCGDFHWMKEVDLPVDAYIGGDIVQELIDSNNARYPAPGRRFIQLDLAADPLPLADAILCRDCLVHLDFPTIARVIDNLRASECRYLLTTSHRGQAQNVDKVTGKHRLLNLEIEPFNWPAPLHVIVETVGSNAKDTGKILGVWRVADIQPPTMSG